MQARYFALLLLLTSPCAAQTQNCVASAVAGGTANAIVIPQLPCSGASNLVMISAAGGNSGAVTIQQVGTLAVPLLKGTGIALTAGDIPGAGFTILARNSGSAWIMLNPSASTGGSPGGATNAVQYNAGSLVFGGVNVMNNAVLVTSGVGLPSESTTLPSTVQNNITGLGTITSGVWNGTAVGVNSGGTGLVSGTAGGLLVFSAPGTMVSTGTFTSGAPILGAGAGLPTSSTRSGTTTEFATISGALIAGNFTKSDASGNLVDAGTAIGTVNAGTAGQLAQYATAGSTISGLTFIPQPGGRLTLTAATPVLSTTVSGATTIYYTPYVGQIVPIYDGTSHWSVGNCGEITNATANSAVGNAGPAAVANNSNYDLFVWVSAGTCMLSRGPAWTSNTARNLTLTRTNGILLNTSNITNGPNALQGTYVGSVCSNGTASIDYIFGGSASGGTAARFCVWNTYNRILTGTTVTDSGSAYAYISATVRQARASAGNQAAYMVGLAEDALFGAAQTNLEHTVLQASSHNCLGLDTTTACTSVSQITYNPVGTAQFFSLSPSGTFSPGIGLHTISVNENGDGANTNNFNTNGTNVLFSQGKN